MPSSRTTHGTGWVFVINAASYTLVLGSLALIRVADLHRIERKPKTPSDFVDGFRYVLKRPDLKVMMLMFFLIGTFGANFQIFLPTMSAALRIGLPGNERMPSGDTG